MAWARGRGQLGVEHAGEGEQVVALVLQRDPHRADASRVLRLASRQLLDDEVEQLTPGGQVRAGQGEDVVAQPVEERADVASEPVCLGLGLPRTMQQLGGQLVVWIALAGAAGLGLQGLAP
jgi:hypothetical protein